MTPVHLTRGSIRDTSTKTWPIVVNADHIVQMQDAPGWLKTQLVLTNDAFGVLETVNEILAQIPAQNGFEGGSK